MKTNRRTIPIIIAFAVLATVALLFHNSGTSQTSAAPTQQFDTDAQWDIQLKGAKINFVPVSGQSHLSVCVVILRQQMRGHVFSQPAMIIRNGGPKCRLSSTKLSGKTDLGLFALLPETLRSQQIHSPWLPTQPSDVVDLPADSDMLVLLGSLPSEIYKSDPFTEAMKTITESTIIDVTSSKLLLDVDSTAVSADNVTWVVVPEQVLRFMPYSFAANCACITKPLTGAAKSGGFEMDNQSSPPGYG